MDMKKNEFTPWCAPSVKIAGTVISELSHSIAQLAVKAAEDPSSVPDVVHIQGDAKSYQEIADIMSGESKESIKVIPGDYEAMKKNVEAQGAANPFGFIR